MAGHKTSVKFRYIVCVAFLGSAALTAITLFSFEKFTQVFSSYRRYDEVRKTLYDFQSAAIKQDFMISAYQDRPQNKLIHKVEDMNQTLAKNLAILESSLDERFKNELTLLAAAVASSVQYTENLFIREADRLGKRQDFLVLYNQLLHVLHYIDQVEPTTKIREKMSAIVVMIDQVNSHPPAFERTLEKKIRDLKDLIHSYPETVTKTQEKIIEQAQVHLEEFTKMALNLGLQKDTTSSSMRHHDDQEVQKNIRKATDDLHDKLVQEQGAIYQSWISNNALARHSMAFVALFTIVSLCWLMVGLSQLFSVRK